MGNTESNFRQRQGVDVLDNVCHLATVSRPFHTPDINFTAICDLNHQLLAENESLKSKIKEQEYWVNNGPLLKTKLVWNKLSLEQTQNDLVDKISELLATKKLLQQHKEDLHLWEAIQVNVDKTSLDTDRINREMKEQILALEEQLKHWRSTTRALEKY